MEDVSNYRDYDSMDACEKSEVDRIVEEYRRGANNGISSDRVMEYMSTLRLDDMNAINSRLKEKDAKERGLGVTSELRMRLLEERGAKAGGNGNADEGVSELQKEVGDLRQEIRELKDLLTNKLK